MIIAKKSAGEFSLPVLGLGTWQMGGRYESDYSKDDQEIAAVRLAIDAGISHIDTAEIYGAGHAEELVGKAITELDRSRLFITSKVAPEHLSYDRVIQACRNSLARLQIKRLDLYLIHWPEAGMDFAAAMRAMDFLLENELIRNIGVSNFDPNLIEEAQSYTKYQIVNNQIHYSLSARGHEEAGTLKYCSENNILVTAYRPLEKAALERSDILKRLAEKYQKPVLAVALNWVLNKPNVVALVKTSQSRHLREDLSALDWRLQSEDEKYLDEHFPRGATMGVGVEP